MPDVTHLDLDVFEKMATLATPGPWYSIGDPWREYGEWPWVVTGGPDPNVATPICDLAIQTGDQWQADADFIAACRTMVPHLITRVRDAEGLLDRFMKTGALMNWAYQRDGEETYYVPVKGTSILEAIEYIEKVWGKPFSGHIWALGEKWFQPPTLGMECYAVLHLPGNLSALYRKTVYQGPALVQEAVWESVP